jgi:HK97 family phage portal protein
VGNELRQDKPGTYLFDGSSVKSIPLSGLSAEIAAGWGVPSNPGLSAPDAFRAVPWIHRAVDLRARAVAGMPYSLYKGTSDKDLRELPEYEGLVRRIKRMFFQIEGDLALYGASYWTLEDQTPRRLLPTTIHPRWSEHSGLVGFDRHINGRVIPLPLRQVLYLWLPTLTQEVGPGVAPAAVALRAAGVLHNLDTYLEGYFKRGAIKTTLLTVKGKNPSKAEMDKLEYWWKSLVSGVKKAFQSVAIKEEIEPVVIGDALKDTVNPELTSQMREDIATALGIQHSLLFSNAANFATANQDVLNFYGQTIEPECDLIEEAINESPWLKREGLHIRFRPEMLEAYQQRELEKAEGIRNTVGKPVLTRNEGREMLGFDPIPGWDEEDRNPPPIVANLPGNADDIEVEAKRFKKWLKKRGADANPQRFFSEILSDELKAAILAEVVASSEVPFGQAVKKEPDEPPADRAKIEEQAATEIAAALEEQLAALVPDGATADELAGATARLDSDEVAQPLRDTLRRNLIASANGGATDAIANLQALGIGVDWTLVNSAAVDWLDGYLFELVGGIQETTRDALQKAIGEWIESGEPLGQLVRELEPVFGRKRAELIAATEVTRGYTEGNRLAWRQSGVVSEVEIQTSEDERVCEICGPLAGTRRKLDDELSPFHVGCRCWQTPVID